MLGGAHRKKIQGLGNRLAPPRSAGPSDITDWPRCQPSPHFCIHPEPAPPARCCKGGSSIIITGLAAALLATKASRFPTLPLATSSRDLDVGPQVSRASLPLSTTQLGICQPQHQTTTPTQQVRGFLSSHQFDNTNPGTPRPRPHASQIARRRRATGKRYVKRRSVPWGKTSGSRTSCPGQPGRWSNKGRRALRGIGPEGGTSAAGIRDALQRLVVVRDTCSFLATDHVVGLCSDFGFLPPAGQSGRRRGGRDGVGRDTKNGL